MKIVLVDRNPALVSAWSQAFQGYADVTVRCGSIFDVKCDALVSPANSFGFMDGGIDAAITKFFGEQVQNRLQAIIRAAYDGELLVGQAVFVKTNHPDIPLMISAPTMRVPMILKDTVNVYLATRAVLLLAKKRAENFTVAIPGMGTGVGRVSPEQCAHQMKAAVDDVKEPFFPFSWKDAQTRHQFLYTDTDDLVDLQFED